MSDLFDIYEDSLKIVIKNVQANIDKNNITENDLELLHTNITEAKRIIKQIDVEISSNTTTISQSEKIKYRNYANEIDKLNKKYLKVQERYIKRKNNDILSFDGIEVSANKKAQKMNLLENEQNDSIEEIKRKTYDIENTGKNIMTNLNTQNDQIRSVRDNIKGLNGEIDESNGIISRMLRRENRNKLIIIIFSVILVIIFILIVMYKFKSAKTPEGTK